MATECQRCVGERRARGTSSVAAFVTIPALLFAASTGCALGWAAWSHGRHLDDPALAAVGFSHLRVLLVFAPLSAALWSLARRLSRRAATPLPPPDGDPLATYREGAAPECARHPFAR